MPGDEAELIEDQPPEVNEQAYLAAFPKIAENVRAGRFKSAADHYARHGAAEGRLEMAAYKRALTEQSLLTRLSAPPSADFPRSPSNHQSPSPQNTPKPPIHLASGIDTLLVAEGGLCIAIGWVDDRGLPFVSLTLTQPDGRTVQSTAFARCRRTDAEAAIGCPPGHLLGFYAVINLNQPQPPAPGATLQITCGPAHQAQILHTPRLHLVTPAALRDHVFEYLAAATYFGSPQVESFLQLNAGIGQALLALNADLSTHITARAHIERHGNHARRFQATIIVCLYGRPEYLFLQAALFAAAPGAADYEYLYISNSPELTEQLQRQASLAAQIYGLAFTMIYLPGNAGFGAANNAAASHAATNRLIILNPDVFPITPDWPARHAALLETLPAEQTNLFGIPLFYDDGSLMHAGMFFEADTGLSIRPDGVTAQPLLRVEHYGKGAPPDFPAFRRSRQVPAITGAFMSADRAWFEQLGGFSEQYVFGHYEDADLCLRAREAGGQVWLHDLPFWHLEGKGSTRLPPHEGGSLINRWHFTQTWLSTIQAGLLGQTPTRLAT